MALTESLLLFALVNKQPRNLTETIKSGISYTVFYGSALFFYIVVNMSMVLGLLPIVGSPLPIMSYGGSSMLATMLGFAIVMSAKLNYKQLIA